MLRFVRLHLHGFKSFVEDTEVLIEPGLTGIIGPNGCGKSNIVEALRWVMGETSAKAMRGGEMDDVIFSGTTTRPPRSFAEVTVVLDNGEGTAPPPFAAEPELHVSRRIERTRGSLYRVNGREVRARDVQLLFTDLASGARSSALVTQGQVAALITAKPLERRLIIEEAAGIIGLSLRRDEAESRLRAAEANLQRVEDVLATLATQRAALARQIKQARHYRQVSAKIQAIETALLARAWRAAVAEQTAAAARLADVEHALSRLTHAAAEASARQAEIAAELPGLRRAESEAAAARHRIELERRTIEDEDQSVASALAALKTQHAQAESDLAHAATLFDDALAAQQRLAAERLRLAGNQQGEGEVRAAAVAEIDRLSREIAEAEARQAEAQERIARLEARRASLRQTAQQLSEKRKRLEMQHEAATRQQQALAAELTRVPDVAASAEAQAAAAAALAAAEAARDGAERRHLEAVAAARDAMRGRQEAEATLARLEAEAAALVRVAALDTAGTGPPVVDALSVDAGFEQAVAGALGDDGFATLDPALPDHWRALPPLARTAPLPGEVTALAAHVGAPAALARWLSGVGVVDSADEADRLAPLLAPGQCLVSRDGATWRWDGLVRGGGRGRTAARLEHRSRFAALTSELAAARSRCDDHARAASARDAHAAAAAAAERTARAEHRAAEQHHERARAARVAAEEARARLALRDDALAAQLRGLAEEIAAAAAEARSAAEAYAGLADPVRERDAAAAGRAALDRLRADLLDRRTALAGLDRDAEAWRRRSAAVAAEEASWQRRLAEAERQRADLAARRTTIAAETARLEQRQHILARQRSDVLDRLLRAEQDRARAGDALATADLALAAADRAVRETASDLAATREAKVRADGHLAQATAAREAAERKIAERLGVSASALAAAAGADDLPADDDDGERRLDRLRRERDLIGPVNLRAEEEDAALARNVDDLDAQRRDLVCAIGKLRRALGDIDAEGRARLQAAFAAIDDHFRSLFTQLFGGGEARLSLTAADDPLGAGLDVVAAPPGKRPQSLSLLSGGEQALTALALRFAVFLSRPAPVCVLDEVDAPLDDANVDRFCALLADLADAGTRFLVVTHQRLTMARMDRLYGVTMAERGVSQLVSVDLSPAAGLRSRA